MTTSMHKYSQDFKGQTNLGAGKSIRVAALGHADGTANADTYLIGYGDYLGHFNVTLDLDRATVLQLHSALEAMLMATTDGADDGAEQ